MTATGPDSGVSTPSLIVLPSKPGTLLGAPPEPPESDDDSLSAAPPQPPTTSASAAARITSLRIPSPLSIRERPGLEVGLHPQPHGGQPTRLEHQEQHDQQAEDGLVEREHRDEPAVAGAGGDA